MLRVVKFSLKLLNGFYPKMEHEGIPQEESIKFKWKNRRILLMETCFSTGFYRRVEVSKRKRDFSPQGFDGLKPRGPEKPLSAG